MKHECSPSGDSRALLFHLIHIPPSLSPSPSLHRRGAVQLPGSICRTLGIHLPCQHSRFVPPALCHLWLIYSSDCPLPSIRPPAVRSLSYSPPRLVPTFASHIPITFAFANATQVRRAREQPPVFPHTPSNKTTPLQRAPHLKPRSKPQ